MENEGGHVDVIEACDDLEMALQMALRDVRGVRYLLAGLQECMYSSDQADAVDVLVRSLDGMEARVKKGLAALEEVLEDQQAQLAVYKEAQQARAAMGLDVQEA